MTSTSSWSSPAPPNWRRYFGAQAYLEDLFGRPVDLSTIGEVRSAIRPYVERDAIDCVMPRTRVDLSAWAKGVAGQKSDYLRIIPFRVGAILGPAVIP